MALPGFRRLAIGMAVLANAARTTAASSLSPRLTNETTPASSTFIYCDPPAAGNLTFSLTAAQNGDLFLHLSAPADNQWVAVGIGSQMKGALMFLVYHDSSGKNVTFSPRVATGRNEPSYRSSIACSIYEPPGLHVGVFTNDDSDDDLDYYSVYAHCKDVKSALPDLSLDLNSTSQPFIFAVGPDNHGLYSDAKDADIRRHASYGGFSMDMRKATEDNSTIAGTAFGTQMEGAQERILLQEDDGNHGSTLHAAFMCGTFLFFFPLGIILLRGLERVKLHAGAQTAGLICVGIGVGIGVWISGFYNKDVPWVCLVVAIAPFSIVGKIIWKLRYSLISQSKKVDSAHQIIGLIVFALLFVQLGLGFFHHRIYLRSRSPTTMGKIHRYLGPFLLGAGLANGFIGFRFADARHSNIVYLLLVVAVFVVLMGGAWYKRRKDRQEPSPNSGPRFGPDAGPSPAAPPPYSSPIGLGLHPDGGYAQSQSSRSDIALGDIYYGGTQPTQPRAMV